MEDWVDHGIVLLMDVGALAGKYGRGAKKTAEKMLDSGLCYAVCSDAHSTADIPGIAQGITRLKRLVGKDESTFLLSEGPRRILEGNVDL
jgi:protein-tyrosine phosphatase